MKQKNIKKTKSTQKIISYIVVNATTRRILKTRKLSMLILILWKKYSDWYVGNTIYFINTVEKY